MADNETKDSMSAAFEGIKLTDLYHSLIAFKKQSIPAGEHPATIDELAELRDENPVGYNHLVVKAVGMKVDSANEASERFSKLESEMAFCMAPSFIEYVEEQGQKAYDLIKQISPDASNYGDSVIVAIYDAKNILTEKQKAELVHSFLQSDPPKQHVKNIPLLQISEGVQEQLIGGTYQP
ncbi:hypothetical protein ACFL0W_03155 [Nanoarchaeota archaeon]